MENIKACIRIKPLLSDCTEEVVCEKLGENSVLNIKSKEKFDFGK